MASGYFVWDASDWYPLLDFDVHVSGGDAFSDFHYSFENASMYTILHNRSGFGWTDTGKTPWTIVWLSSQLSDRHLQLVFTPLLTDDGGTVAIHLHPWNGPTPEEPFRPWTSSSEWCELCDSQRAIVSGAVVGAVPEPATFLLMLVGLATVGAAASYRRRRTAVASSRRLSSG